MNDGSQHQTTKMFDFATKLEDTSADMLEAVTRLHEIFSTLIALRPDSLNADDNDGDDPDGNA